MIRPFWVALYDQAVYLGNGAFNKRQAFRPSFMVTKFKLSRTPWRMKNWKFLMNNQLSSAIVLRFVCHPSRSMSLLQVQKEYGSFDAYLWCFCRWENHIPDTVKHLPSLSEKISKGLKNEASNLDQSLSCPCHCRLQGASWWPWGMIVNGKEEIVTLDVTEHHGNIEKLRNSSALLI